MPTRPSNKYARQAGSSKLYGAICAAPALVLQTHGLLAGKQATCYPADRFTGGFLHGSG